jgi:hypothetical protein
MGRVSVSEVTEAVYAGVDLGTSGCKGVLVTADGRIVAAPPPGTGRTGRNPVRPSSIQGTG